MIIRKIGLEISFFVQSVCGFGTRELWPHEINWAMFLLFLFCRLILPSMCAVENFPMVQLFPPCCVAKLYFGNCAPPLGMVLVLLSHCNPICLHEQTVGWGARIRLLSGDILSGVLLGSSWRYSQWRPPWVFLALSNSLALVLMFCFPGGACFSFPALLWLAPLNHFLSSYNFQGSLWPDCQHQPSFLLAKESSLGSDGPGTVKRVVWRILRHVQVWEPQC